MSDFTIGSSNGKPVTARGNVRLAPAATDDDTLARLRKEVLLDGRDSLVLRDGEARWHVSAARIARDGGPLAPGDRLQGWRSPDGQVRDALVEHADHEYREPKRESGLPAAVGVVLTILVGLFFA